MSVLYAWAKPANLIGRWADHTWVTTYDNRQQVLDPLDAVIAAGEHLWMCWGAFHPAGGAPGHPDGLIGAREGARMLAGCLVGSNADSVKDPVARGTVTLYGIEGVCHQVANQALFATRTAESKPLSVKGSRGYRKSVYFYWQYGRRDAAWAEKVRSCTTAAGVVAQPDEDDFLAQARLILADRSDLLERLRSMRSDYQTTLDGFRVRRDLTAEEIDESHRVHLAEVAALLGEDRFVAIFEQAPEDEMNLVDPVVFAASREGGSAGG